MPKPSENETNLKQQRDRFLAFAFASSDLFIEIGSSENIIFTMGAPKSLAGFDKDSMIGRNWMSLFSPKNQKEIQAVCNNAVPGRRCGPMLVTLNELVTDQKAILTAFRMPQSESLYITLGFSNAFTEKFFELIEDEPQPIVTGFQGEEEILETIETDFTPNEDSPEQTFEAPPPLEQTKAATTDFTPDAETSSDLAPPQALPDLEEDESLTTGYTADDEPLFNDGIYNREQFTGDAESIFKHTREKNIEPALTVFNFDQTENIPDEHWERISQDIANLMNTQSATGQSAAEISKNQFALIHDQNADIEDIGKQINKIVNKYCGEDTNLDITNKTIETELDQLTNHEASRALFHTLNEFDQKGTDLKTVGLKTGYDALVKNNKGRYHEFKDLINRVDFDMRFLPVTNFKTHEPDHFEILSRMKDGDIKDWITFGEDVGLCGDFDLAVIERTLNYLNYKAGASRTCFSTNISPQSIETAEFYKKVKMLLNTKDFKTRMIFEITDTHTIQNVDTVTAFYTHLRKDGYKVALDNFGGGKISPKHLKKHPVDIIKTSHKFTQTILTNPQSAERLKKLIDICEPLKIQIIAKHVENQEQETALEAIGIEIAQGFHYGQATAAPEFIPSKK